MPRTFTTAESNLLFLGRWSSPSKASPCCSPKSMISTRTLEKRAPAPSYNSDTGKEKLGGHSVFDILTRLTRPRGALLRWWAPFVSWFLFAPPRGPFFRKPLGSRSRSVIWSSNDISEPAPEDFRCNSIRVFKWITLQESSESKGLVDREPNNEAISKVSIQKQNPKTKLANECAQPDHDKRKSKTLKVIRISFEWLGSSVMENRWKVNYDIVVESSKQRPTRKITIFYYALHGTAITKVD